MKTYTDEELSALVEEVKDQFLTPLFAQAKEELVKSQLAKAESGKQVSSPKEGGNGTVPESGGAPNDEGQGGRSGAFDKPGKSGSGSPSSFTAKAEGDPSAPSPSPAAEPAQDEAPADAGGDSPAADPSASAGSQDPAMADQGQGDDLKQAYGQLDDDSLRAHLEALKGVMMERMGGGEGQPQQDMASASPAPSPSPSPAGPSASPSPSAAPSPSPAPDMAMKSEKAVLDLQKGEIEELKQQVSGLTDILTKVLSKPEKKVISSVAELGNLSKSENSVGRMSKEDVDHALKQKAQEPNLKKSDQDLIVRHFTTRNVNVKDLAHLLK